MATLLMQSIDSGDDNHSLEWINLMQNKDKVDEKGETALIEAVSRGNNKIAQFLIENGTDVNITDKDGKTALITAVLRGNNKIAQALIERSGADVNVADKEGKTALITALNCKNDDIALELIISKNGVDVNIRNRDGETALMVALDCENEIIANALITNGADVNIADTKGKTPLMRTLSHHMDTTPDFYGLPKEFCCPNTEIALALITADGVDLNIRDQKGETALIKALGCIKDEIAIELIKKGADVNIPDNFGETALMKALYRKDDKIARELINSGGVDLNIRDKKGETALMKAVRNRNDSIALELINSGADVNITDKKGETALMKALDNGNVEIALELIKGNADASIADRHGKTALMKALYYRNDEIAIELINKDAHVNMPDHNMALTIALDLRNDKMALALISGGANVNFVDKKGKTALMKAVHDGNDKIVQELIENGADVNIADNKGETALMKALHHGNDLISLKLINSGANVDIADNEGKTALVKALQYGNETIALELIKIGADVNIAERNGETALMHCKNSEITLHLIAAGAQVDMIDNRGNSALMYAVQNENVVDVLLGEGRALVNMTNFSGRSPLFYAILEDNHSAQYILNHGGNLHLTDNFNISILSFFINHCISDKFSPSHIHKVLNLINEKGIDEQAVPQAILNAAFCKFPSYVSTASENLLPLLEVAAVQEVNPHRKKGIENIIKIIGENKIICCNLSEILSLLVNLGVNPNTPDENGNTALHNVLHLCLRESGTKVLDICYEREEFGLTINKRNCNHETPLLHLLSDALNLMRERREIPGIEQMVNVCRFLLKDPRSVKETLPSGKSVFHLIIQLLQEGLTLQDMDYQQIFLYETVYLLEMFSSEFTTEAVNKVDDQMNSPLHYWASLSLPRNASKYPTEKTFKELQRTTFKQLLKIGAMVNARNRKNETPLHYCKSWSALRLLVDAGANTSDVDLAGRLPLHVAARFFLQKPNCFYPDVTVSPPVFWKDVANMGFDLWACDKDGKSIVSHLIESEAYVHAKALVEIACDEKLSKSDEGSVCVLNAICKDRSSRATWKPILVQMILKSQRRPLDLNAFLRLCCMNIINHESSCRVTENDRHNHSYLRRTSSVTPLSVHLQVAKELLLYGANASARDTNGECWLDLADSCPVLKALLTESLLSMDDVPMVIPWTSYSEEHQKKLAKVARGQNCKAVETYWYYNEHIANGAFSYVFVGISKYDGMEVAIKRTEKLRMECPHDKREIKTFSSLSDCEKIVRYLSFYECEHFSYIVLELMEGNLDEYFECKVYDPVKSVKLSKDVVSGLKYLHDHKIIHRDLKPTNILYKTHPNLCLKIADFGLSRRLDVNSSTTVMGGNVGTRAWIAPEVVNSPDQTHATSSDIFSCGLIIHYILSPQRHPFDPTERTGKCALKISTERESNVLNNRMEGWDNSLAPEISDLVKRMLDSDEKKRPSASQSLDHPMFWSDKKKMDLLRAVGDQPEFECRRVKRTSLTMVELDLEANFSSIITYPKWDDPRFTNMSGIVAEMTKPVIRGKGSIPPRRYDTRSVVELVRFIRNSIAHVSDIGRPGPIKDLILSKSVFLKEFPNLVMEIYKTITVHRWNEREEIRHAIRNK